MFSCKICREQIPRHTSVERSRWRKSLHKVTKRAKFGNFCFSLLILGGKSVWDPWHRQRFVTKSTKYHLPTEREWITEGHYVAISSSMLASQEGVLFAICFESPNWDRHLEILRVHFVRQWPPVLSRWANQSTQLHYSDRAEKCLRLHQSQPCRLRTTMRQALCVTFSGTNRTKK